MKQDRRSFLKLFGTSTAAVATLDGIEKVHDPTAEPRMPSDYLRNMAEVNADVLYSAVTIPKNAMESEYHLFSQTIGMYSADGTRVTRADTNMQQSNTLPEPNRFCVKRIGFAFSPKTEPGLRSAFCDRYYLKVGICNKVYWQQPLSFCFGKGEPDRDRGFTSQPDVHMVDLDIPLILDMGVYFSAELIGDPIHPCGKLKGWALLGGLHARAVQ
jgi:hypothetical protein